MRGFLRYSVASVFYNREIKSYSLPKSPTAEIETMQRLNLVNNEEELIAQKIKAEEDKQKKWMVQMMEADIPD